MSENTNPPPTSSSTPARELTVSSENCPEGPVVPNPACETCENGRSLAAVGQCCRDFRKTLGAFATGITVISALSPEGKPIGVTISSFNSVSLDPPLILWSLALKSPNLEAFRNARHFAVNVLSAKQQHLSDRFASPLADRFAYIPTRTGLSGTPLLEGCCAWFECTNEVQYPGGDHLILIGRVERFAKGEADSPLLFHNGCYRQLDDK